MRRIAAFTVVSADREPAPRIRLRRAEDGAVIDLDAATLLAQFETAAGDVLLVLDEDCPYEEQLHLVLVRRGRVADHIVIGGWYATGTFEALGSDGDTLRFRFADDGVLALRVGDSSWWPERLPAGARREGGWLGPRLLHLSEEKKR